MGLAENEMVCAASYFIILISPVEIDPLICTQWVTHN